MGLLSQQYGKILELPAGSTLCTPTIRANANNSSGCVRFGNVCVGSESLYNTIQSAANLHLRAASNCPIIIGDSGSTHTKVCNCLCTTQLIGTKVSVGSLNTSYDLYNNGTSYLNGAVTIDDSLTITGARILKTGGYNKPGVQMTGTGNYSFCDLNVFLKNTGAANSAIFSDYEPHGEWGLFHDNQADAFYITAGSSCHNVGSFNMKNCAGTVRTAYIKQKFLQGNGTAEIGGHLSVSPDCSNNFNGIAIGCPYTNISSWHTQLNMYGTSHVVARWNHNAGTNSGNNAKNNCIFAHSENPFVILSSGHIRLCGQDTVCITGKAVACTYVQSPKFLGTTCVCSPIVCGANCVVTGDLCLTEDYSGDMSNGIQLGRNIGIPQAAWGESGGQTGRIEIGLPTRDGEGGTNHLGMIHMTVDVYEYNGNDVMTFIIGGHNWSCRWYNCGAHILGGCTDKSIKLAYHACGGTCNGRYVVLIGECDSTWTYGSVHVRRINNGLYYNGNLDVGTPMYVKRVTCPDSYYNCTSGDLRSGANSMAGYQCATVCFHGPRVCATTCVRTACVQSTGSICAAAHLCGTDFCASEWFRNATGKGIYNSGTGVHWYSSASNDMRIYGGSANNIGITGYACGANRGCIHWNCDNQIHIYDSGGTARFLINSSNDIRLCNTVCFYGDLKINGASGLVSGTYGNCFYPDNCAFWNVKAGGSSSNVGIKFRDSGGTIDGYLYADNGHIGFLDQGAQWAYGHKNDTCHWWNVNNVTRMKLVPNILDLTSSSASFQLRMFTCNTTTTRGSFYANCSNNVGILDKDSNWAIRHVSSGCTEFRIGNSTKSAVESARLYHTAKLEAPTVFGSTCVCTPVVCATSEVQSCRFQHHWRTIAPGGDYDKFYPISFTMRGGSNSEDILEIAQGNVHSPTSSCGAMYLKLGLNITGWGHISNHYIVHKYSTGGTNTLVSKVRPIDHSTCRVGVWLRGGVTYYFRSREGTIACNITNGTTNCCIVYDNANNAYDTYVQYTSNVEDCNFGNQGGCNAGNAYLNHHSSLGTSVVLTTGNLQQALCCGCYTNTVCLGNCGVIKNTNFTTGTVCGNDLVRGGHVCGANCVTTQMLCSHKCVLIDQGTMRLDGGSCNAGDDATLFVTAATNNDWGIIVCKNQDSASEYGLDLRMGATSTAAMYARFNNTIKFKLQYNCLWHDTMICSPAIKSSSYMNSGKFCAGSAYLCNGCLNVNGNATLNSRITFSGGSNQYLEIGTNSIALKNSSGSVLWSSNTGGGLCGTTLTSGLKTTAVGCGALANNTGNGCFNTAVGFQAMYTNTQGNESTAVGYQSLYSQTTSAWRNTAVGMHSLYTNSCGRSNTAMGYDSMCKNTTGEFNSAFGIDSLRANTSGTNNVALGRASMDDNTCGSYNTASGTYAMAENTSGCHNTASGYRALFCNQSGGCNTAVGYSALEGNTAMVNTAIGAWAMCGSTTGVCNTAVGQRALTCNTTGSRNIAIGTCAMCASTTGSRNIGIGEMALAKSCGYGNVAIGLNTMDNNTNGWNNIAIGKHALKANTTGCCNTASGYSAGVNSQSGCNNVFIGYNAGCGFSSNTSNIIAIGNSSTINTYICGCLHKTAGTFNIPHPDPAKREKYDLQHSFVESPTEGDNIYRWSTETTGCRSVIELPDYYRYLNKNDQVWISPVCHFGNAYGEVTEDQKCLIVCSQADGSYNVLLIGTRKDEAVKGWSGPEVHPLENR